ncbi:molybdenum cofactor guanylyltransferase [Niveibacterium umoris]|uniref:Molybdenum cofactor guanylyltransferase n=1 Tax=Niveibacterium umoris TaxID=1193620 RepID=A0A840BJR9_9RHOO|nr:molybdenum cofactor guanylyltransferase MobA [Niveibacterium umoris]MBB4011819.1 molybdopterin-guanine dinucleotide biosynthesis protein A [Niveibacterium umoris]
MSGDTITGLILAGGAGSRVGGVDKGWIEWQGRPLIEWVIDAIAPQVGPIIISANRNLDRYRALGFPVVTDLRPGFAGPLAGVEAGLAVATTPDVLVVPCDGPTLPTNLVERLHNTRGEARAATVSLDGRLNPLHSLLERALVANLSAWLDTGERKVATWLAAIGSVPVPFDDPSQFQNLNHGVDVKQGQSRV